MTRETVLSIFDIAIVELMELTIFAAENRRHASQTRVSVNLNVGQVIIIIPGRRQITSNGLTICLKFIPIRDVDNFR